MVPITQDEGGCRMATSAAIEDTAVVELQPQPTVAVRIKQPMAELDLAKAFDTYLPFVGRRVGELGAEMAGAPFGRYHAFGPQHVDVEIGIPVVALPAGLQPLASVPAGELGTSELPGGLVAKTTLRGPYDGLKDAYDALHSWIHEQPGVDDANGPWESYIDDPTTVEPSQLRTEIIWPLHRT
jgi:effector-binding domain-containing protein